MLKDRESFFHRVGILSATSLNLQFGLTRMIDVHEPIDSRLAVCFDFNRRGTPVYSLEEPLKPAGNEIFVRRQYFKLVNHPTLLKGFVSERVPLNDGETVKSGDRVEVVLTVEAKNNYEYLLFEDLKPAGLEAVQIRSGEGLHVRELKSGGGFTGRSRWVYQELRDRKVALFIDRLPEGVWQISYEMRAEAPGAFHALPVLGHAMYVPEIRTNGAEMRVRVVD